MAEGDDHETDFTYNEEDIVEGTADHEEGLVDDADDLLGGTGDADNGDAELDESAIGIDDPELEAIKERVREMEEEAEKLKEMQSEVDRQMNLSNLSSSSLGSPPAPSMEDRIDADCRSVWVGGVDYGATAEELEQHFHGCGSINRVTILCDKFSGHPKGFAYVEFTDKESVQTAEALDDSLFRGRQIKVTAKRTNRPGISTTNRQPRGRFRRANRFSSCASGYQPRPRGRYGRPRRSNFYSPY